MHTIRIKNKLSDQEEIEELVVEVRTCIFSGEELRSGTTSSETKSRVALSGGSLVSGTLLREVQKALRKGCVGIRPSGPVRVAWRQAPVLLLSN